MYSLHQWIFLFYIYCFFGWTWESCYVSIEKHRLVNRGFLKGPFLPIYGAGAIIVLGSTILVVNNIALIFVVGMISATILEYITGVLMEKLFHIRYWDYSEQKLNINGHICLTSSLAWGVFSVILVKIANPVIEQFIMLIPGQISEGATYIITIFITIDCFKSFNAAMDLKNILITITEKNETIYHIKRRLEVFEAVINDDINSIKEKIISREKRAYINSFNLLRRNPSAKAKRYEKAMIQIRELYRENKEK